MNRWNAINLVLALSWSPMLLTASWQFEFLWIGSALIFAALGWQLVLLGVIWERLL